MKDFNREIFEKLGNLFYALAADEHVSTMASGELKMVLRKDWLAEPDEPSADRISEAAHLIVLSIDSLQNERIPPGEAYNSFVEFYGKHHEQFSHALKEKILETADAIVKIFASGRKNPHIEQLKDMLQPSRQDTEVRS